MPANKKNSKQKIGVRPKKINLALQGGGSHGAFTWGVLERFLEEESIEIEGISAVGVGAMNAALFSHGVNEGGPAKAQELLESFWKKVSALGSMSPFQPSILDKMMGSNDMTFSPSFFALDYLTRLFSPYQFNFFDLNRFRKVLASLINFRNLKKGQKVDLFINATNVRTGDSRVFSKSELEIEMLLAASCMPFISKSVEVEGEFYWDGGYSGNPLLKPLLDQESRDIVIIQINPLSNEEVPAKAQDILNRVNEVSFNNSLKKELEYITEISAIAHEHKIKSPQIRETFLHMIEAEEIMSGLGAASKFNADWDFLSHLREVGYQAANDWLERNQDKIGSQSTFTLK